jgi:penicillin-binding protein 1A
MALPIWALYMKQCYEDAELEVSTAEFKKPEELTIETDCEKWKNQGFDNSIPDELELFN